MTTTPAPQGGRPPLLAAVTRLHASLDALGDALTTWCLDDVTATGAALAAALEGLPDTSDRAAAARDPALADALHQTAKALARCRRLGTSLDQLVWRGLHPSDGRVVYGRPGRSPASVPSMVLRTEA